MSETLWNSGFRPKNFRNHGKYQAFALKLGSHRRNRRHFQALSPTISISTKFAGESWCWCESKLSPAISRFAHIKLSWYFRQQIAWIKDAEPNVIFLIENNSRMEHYAWIRSWCESKYFPRLLQAVYKLNLSPAIFFAKFRRQFHTFVLCDLSLKVTETILNSVFEPKSTQNPQKLRVWP